MTERLFSNLLNAGEKERFTQLQKLYEKENINFKTDLTDDEIQAILMLEFTEHYLKQEWKIKGLHFGFITQLFKELKISRKRLGRIEAITVLKEQALGEEEKGKSTLRKIAGF